MPLLAVRHLTEYRYTRPVAFGEHSVIFRPRDSYDQRLLDATIEISPRPGKLRWLHDVFGNCVAVAQFAERSDKLHFESVIRLDHSSAHALDFAIEDYAEPYPFAYGAEDMPDLIRCIERQYLDPDREVDRWARQFVAERARNPTFNLLAEMTCAIKRDFRYLARSEKGVQDSIVTLRLVIDCNRATDHIDSIAERSEATAIPGNTSLTAEAREQRQNAIFMPYHDAIAALLDRRQNAGRATIVIAQHSFTPVFHGSARPWQAGMLYDRDPRIGHALGAMLRDEGFIVGDSLTGSAATSITPFRITRSAAACPISRSSCART